MRFIIRDYNIMKLGEGRSVKASGDEPEAIYRYFRRVVTRDPAHEPDKEHLVVLCLNARLEVFGWHLACLGTLNEVCFHPREVLRPAIMSGAYGFVLAHNHPSGDPSPSTGDDRCTRRLVEAADLMQIKFLDHVIVGRRSRHRAAWFSFREHGIIP